MVTPHKCLKSERPSLDKPNNSCALMVRLPCGRSIRVAFPADSPLQSVYDHVHLIEPSLSPCTLRSSYPARHFSDVDLLCSLHELGLTPNATLCVCPKQIPSAVHEANPRPQVSCVSAPLGVTSDPHHVIAEGHVASDPHHVIAEGYVAPDPHHVIAEGHVAPDPHHVIEGHVALDPHHVIAEGDVLRAALSAPAHSVSLNVHMREGPHSRPVHHWGAGRPLQEHEAVGNDEIEGVNVAVHEHRQPLINSHQWPEHGIKLRDSNQGSRAPLGNPPSPEDSPQVMARAAAELRQGNSERPTAITETLRVQAVPSLRHLSLQAVLNLISAPSMQYSRSFSRVTPEIVELIIDHMIEERVLRPRTLELFGGCPIHRISLRCYQYCTNELIRHLRNFPSLKTLNMSSCSLLTDQGLSVVKYLHKLQYLNLGACLKLTDTCLPHLLGLNHLSQLILDQTKVSDKGLCSFLLQAQCSLTHLSVNETSVSESSLNVLSQSMMDVRVLSVKHTQISDISSLSRLKRLHTLHLDNTHVSQQSLMTVTSLPALSTLTVSGVSSLNSDRVLEGLSGLSLTRVVLPGRRCLSDIGLSHLSGLQSLVELYLTDHTQITDQGVQHVSALKMLRILSLCNTSVSDSGLLYLRDLRHLENLCLDRTKVTSRGVSRCIPHLPHLQVLGLSDTNVGDNVVKHGIRHCRHLVKVNLSRTRITNKGLRFLKQVSITQLSLDGSGITSQAVSDLMSACVSLTSVRANSLRVIPTEDISDDDDEEPPTLH
ncbi:uncharacterized protein LOC108704637 [Xenopus laevis]|uniref:Uncharacterized protein LOC108704637 n=1 Tax=Xenopus laevis TaxID=8355 RepID=A0A8J1KZK8_XENLA|nr:uncharacterized protein LOC108704637 [Xenopus laevis]